MTDPLKEDWYEIARRERKRVRRTEAEHKALLSACKQWREATLSRLRMIAASSRRPEPEPMKCDQRLLEEIERQEGP